MKRFLAVFLVLVMVFTQIPFSAFADDLEFEEFEEFDDFDAAPSSVSGADNTIPCVGSSRSSSTRQSHMRMALPLV